MHISGTDLQNWAPRISASSTFPELIRRLILASSPALVSMRAGEGVRLSGFDGSVELHGSHNHIPQGRSVWEMGVNAGVKGKADSDYDTRTANPLTAIPADTTFVFVTPRRWAGKDQWTRQKKAQGVWKDVRVFDADDLEGWLSTAPGVSAWLAPILGKPFAGIFSAETYWTSWAGVTRPPLEPELVLAGWNDDPRKTLEDFLAGPPSALAISAESREVAAAFLAAHLIAGGDASEKSRARTVFAEDEASWAALVHQGKPAVLVPLFDRLDRATAAVGQGHHIVLPLGRRAKSSAIKLQRQSRRRLREALDALALAEEHKEGLATLGRRSLLSLRRKLAYEEAIHRPAWATPAQAQALIGPALAGSWSADRPGDQEALSKLAGQPYDDVQRDVVRLATEDDPPLRRTGSTWMVTSKEDAWGLVAPLLSDTDVRRFEDVVVKVLGAVDPSFDLPEEQRPLASFLGKELSHSGFLREDLADTLIVMAMHADDVSWGLAQAPQTIADRVVRTILAVKDLDAWRTVAWVLPKLAEASPSVFLDAVEQALDTGTPDLPALFQKWEALGFGPGPAYPGLLWALERLAWSPLYLQRAALLLGRLWKGTADRNLPDGPLNKLLEIFKLWTRNTSAPLDQKIAVIDNLRRQMPDVAWPLMQGLLPGHHDHSTPTSRPDWRDWGQWEPREIPRSEMYAGVSLLMERLLEDAQASAHQPIALLPHLRWMTAEQFDNFCALLRRGLSSAGQEQQVSLSERLREFVGRHREFAEADWAVEGGRLEALEAIQETFRPADPVRQHRWLFKAAPWIGVGRRGADHDAYFKEVQDRRVAALGAVVEAEGLAGVLRLLNGLAEPHEAYWVGQALAQLPDRVDLAPPTIRALLDGATPGRGALSGFLHARLAQEGRHAVQARLLAPETALWPVEERGFLLMNLPPDDETWDVVARQGPEVERSYWQRINYYGQAANPAQERRAFDQLLSAGRPAAAFDLARLRDVELAGEEWKALLLALVPLDAETLHNRAHEIREALDRLGERPDVASLEVAQLAWALLPLFRFEQMPKALSRELLNNPKLFAEVVNLAFPNPQDGEADERQKMYQERAFTLIFDLRGVPGGRQDGTIDGAALLNWVRTAREFFQELGQGAIGDDRIGALLASARPDAAGQWPPPEVCEVVEEVASKALADGFQSGRFNLRGVTSRALDDGGGQERDLAQRYETRATELEGRWPRTAAIMRRLAQGYLADATRHDEQADLTQDRWR